MLVQILKKVFLKLGHDKIYGRLKRSKLRNIVFKEDNSITSKNSDEINEGLLEDGVSLKTEGVNSEEEVIQNHPENELAEQRNSE